MKLLRSLRIWIGVQVMFLGLRLMGDSLGRRQLLCTLDQMLVEWEADQ